MPDAFFFLINKQTETSNTLWEMEHSPSSEEQTDCLCERVEEGKKKHPHTYTAATTTLPQ